MPVQRAYPVTSPPEHHFFGYYEKSPWDRGGTKVCFDSTHEGTRQMYVLDVSEYVS